MEKKIISNGNKLLAIRKALCKNQAEMAILMGITQSHYSNLESGKKNVASHLISLLFDQLNVSPSWFYKDEGKIFIDQLTSMNEIENISNGNKNHILDSHLNSHSSYPDGLPKEDNDTIDDDLYDIKDHNNNKAYAKNYWKTEKYIHQDDLQVLSETLCAGSYNKRDVRLLYQLTTREIRSKTASLMYELKYSYSSYYKLTESINRLYLAYYNECFYDMVTWEDFINSVNQDLKDEYMSIQDKKLRLIFFLLGYLGELQGVINMTWIATSKLKEVSEQACLINSKKNDP